MKQSHPPQGTIIAAQVQCRIDNDHQPRGQPFGCGFVEACDGTFAPGMPGPPQAVFGKNDVAHQPKAIDQKVGPKDDRHCRRRTNEEKWKAIERRMAEGRPGTLVLVKGHPVALRHEISEEMQN